MRRLISFLFVLMAFAAAQTTHTVQKGDTLFSIAKRYGVPLETIQVLNEITDPTQIEIGQVLKLSGKVTTKAVQRLQNLPTGVDWVSLPTKIKQGETFRVHFAGLTKQIDVQFLGQTLSAKNDLLLTAPRLQKPGIQTVNFSIGGETFSTTLELVGSERGKQAITLAPDRIGLLDDSKKTAAERTRLIGVCAANVSDVIWKKAWARPTKSDRITTTYGILRSYNGGPYSGYHEGLDYGAPTGQPVYAPAPARVGLAEPLYVRGNGIVLQHGMGVCSGYWHLSKILVKPGQYVKTGQLIGYVGTTGLSTGPHLHYEIRVHGIPTDPAPWYLATP